MYGCVVLAAIYPDIRLLYITGLSTDQDATRQNGSRPYADGNAPKISNITSAQRNLSTVRDLYQSLHRVLMILLIVWFPA